MSGGQVFNEQTREWEWPITCGNGCGTELGNAGYKIRYIPGKRGRRRVCEPCAQAIDAQATIDVKPRTPERPAPVRLALHRGSQQAAHVCEVCTTSFRWPGELEAHQFQTGHGVAA